MANLQKVVKVTQQQYDTLKNGGTVGSYTGLNANYIYLVVDNNEYITTTGGQEIMGDLTIDGNLQVMSDNSAGNISNTHDVDTWYQADGISMYDNTEDKTYNILFPSNSGTLAVTSDIPQVKRYI